MINKSVWGSLYKATNYSVSDTQNNCSRPPAEFFSYISEMPRLHLTVSLAIYMLKEVKGTSGKYIHRLKFRLNIAADGLVVSLRHQAKLSVKTQVVAQESSGLSSKWA